MTDPEGPAPTASGADGPTGPTDPAEGIEGAEVIDEGPVGDPPRVRPLAGGRHEARESAVHLLYQGEIRGMGWRETVAAQVLAPAPYTVDLLRGVEEHRPELDATISEMATGWQLDRMPRMDVVVMRVGLFELLHRPDVPTAAVLAEAVDLAARYGTDDSARFVNGLLSAAARRVRGEPDGPAPL